MKVGFLKREVNNLVEKEEEELCNGSEAELVCQGKKQSALMEETWILNSVWLSDLSPRIL